MCNCLGLQHSVITMGSPYALGLNESIFPQYFKELDYATHCVGKVLMPAFSFPKSSLQRDVLIFVYIGSLCNNVNVSDSVQKYVQSQFKQYISV